MTIDDVLDRMSRAANELEAKAREHEKTAQDCKYSEFSRHIKEAQRLRHKVSGLRLGQSYLDEYRREEKWHNESDR